MTPTNLFALCLATSWLIGLATGRAIKRNSIAKADAQLKREAARKWRHTADVWVNQRSPYWRN